MQKLTLGVTAVGLALTSCDDACRAAPCGVEGVRIMGNRRSVCSSEHVASGGQSEPLVAQKFAQVSPTAKKGTSQNVWKNPSWLKKRKSRYCWNDRPDLGEGMRYRGSIDTNGNPHGRGTLEYPGKNKNHKWRYSGNFVNGKRDGKGKEEELVYVYDGAISPVWTWTNYLQRSYTGNWKNGARSGQGVHKRWFLVENGKNAVRSGVKVPTQNGKVVQTDGVIITPESCRTFQKWVREETDGDWEDGAIKTAANFRYFEHDPREHQGQRWLAVEEAPEEWRKPELTAQPELPA